MIFTSRPYRHGHGGDSLGRCSDLRFSFSQPRRARTQTCRSSTSVGRSSPTTPARPRLSSLDRLLWVLLYRIWPQVIDAMVLVKPATVVEWHRRGFRLYWRWRSRGPGRPRISPDIRDLIRRMSRANPLWGAPRIHGEPLKLGIKISQATVGRWMPWRPKVPSTTWRSFLRNHLPDIAAIDMFVITTGPLRRAP